MKQRESPILEKKFNDDEKQTTCAPFRNLHFESC